MNKTIAFALVAVAGLSVAACSAPVDEAAPTEVVEVPAEVVEVPSETTDEAMTDEAAVEEVAPAE